MYPILISLHNTIRWLVLASLLVALYKAYTGYVSNSAFTKTDNAVRHWTATIAHIQLMVGMVLYFQSPVVSHFLVNFSEQINNLHLAFFGLIHSSLMLSAIVLITIGSAKAKRNATDSEKFKTMLIWFAVALLVIFIAIPWPFSPFASRPYFR